MKWNLRLLSFWTACAATAAVCAADLPPLTLPQGVGVNIHFTRGHEEDLNRIASGGFKWVRMDFSWGGTEREKGRYDFAAYDELTAGLTKRGLRPIYILDYSNRLYEEAAATRNPINGREVREVASPQHEESIAAFARWAAAAARHFQDKGVVWEIWNEPNIFFWKPEPNVQQYTKLALATAKAIRDAVPNAAIVGPATSQFPWEFLESFFKSGILKYLDAVTVHPYRNYESPPETAGADYRKLRRLIEGAPGGRKDFPILSGEWGYATHRRGVSEATQAAYLVRQQLSNLLHGVPISIWYDWCNDGTNPDEREENFGVVTATLEPKPAYEALKVMVKELSDYRIVRRLPGHEEDYLLLLRNDAGEEKLAVWTLGARHGVALPEGWEAATRIVTGTGRERQLGTGSDGMELPVTALPSYVMRPARAKP